jgi:hypothetical protein
MHALFGPTLAQHYVVDLPTDEGKAREMDRGLGEHSDIAAVIVQPMLQGASLSPRVGFGRELALFIYAPAEIGILTPILQRKLE